MYRDCSEGSVSSNENSPGIRIQKDQSYLLSMSLVILVLGSVVGSRLSPVMRKTVVGQHLLSQVLEKKGLKVTSLRRMTPILKATGRFRGASQSNFGNRKRKLFRSGESSPTQV